jgi:CheY-like chemotaxis protein
MLEHLQLLVADDAPAMRFALVGLLRRAGACVDQAVNGQEVLQQALHKHYDLLLLDVEMPGMDGLETARHLRRAGFSNPLVALCGNSGARRAECLGAGMDEVLPKPCPPPLLLDCLKTLCGKGVPQPSMPSHQFRFPSFRDFCGGDEVFMQRLLSIACDALPAAARGLREAAAAPDVLKMGELAHRVRPSVEGLGLAALANQLRQIENLAQAGGGPALAALALQSATALEAAAHDIRQQG